MSILVAQLCPLVQCEVRLRHLFAGLAMCSCAPAKRSKGSMLSWSHVRFGCSAVPIGAVWCVVRIKLGW